MDKAPYFPRRLQDSSRLVPTSKESPKTHTCRYADTCWFICLVHICLYAPGVGQPCHSWCEQSSTQSQLNPHSPKNLDVGFRDENKDQKHICIWNWEALGFAVWRSKQEMPHNAEIQRWSKYLVKTQHETVWAQKKGWEKLPAFSSWLQPKLGPTTLTTHDPRR